MVAKLDTRKLADTASQLVSQFVDRAPHFQMFMELNEALLKLTNSEYGFIARVFRNQKGPFIKTVALSNIAWNEETKKLYAENAERGMVFNNLDTIFGQVLKTGKTYITLDAVNDPNAAGLPTGHPDLKRFAGIPLVRSDILIGMIGLANGENYCESMLEELKPILDITSHILHATGLQQDLIPDGNYFRQPQAILNTFRSGVLTLDRDGITTSVNQSAAEIFGYPIDQLIGEKVGNLLPPAGADQIYDAEGRFSVNPGVFGFAFEATGVNKVKSYFPIEVSVDRVPNSDPTQFALVVRDISEDKKRERFKNEFISMISHELRTPLTAVHISLSMLDSPEHRPKSIEELNEMISIANRNCERLVHQVDEILDYEKLNLDEIDFNFSQVHLNEILEPVKETTRILAVQSNVDLKVISNHIQSSVAVDASRLSQVLINLITNAIRASQPGQSVELSVTDLPVTNQLRFSVQDSGSGIADEHLEQIFEPFKQVGENPAGAGLGLAICKRIIENHDSELCCQSQLDKGTRFHFDLFKYVELVARTSTKNPTESKTVLWVENEKNHFDSLTSRLDLANVRYHHAPNSQLAKDFLNRNPIDLMIIGYPLVLESCIEFVHQIRGSEFPKTPILLYSNGLNQELASELNRLNVDCAIKKSWNHSSLLEKINAVLRIK